MAREARKVDPQARRGRGATGNASGRYERHDRVAFDDGWESDPDAPLRTEVHVDATRRIIARNTSPDISFDRSINPYRGCEHGCVYCFARPTHAFLGLSPGLDFETRLFVKPNAAKLLDRELRRPKYAVAPIAIGTNTDPYQPIERERRVMRSVLTVLRDFGHPVSVVTKGPLIARDADILGEMGRQGLARAAMSLTSLDNRLSRRMEPRAGAPAARLRALETLRAAGCPVGVMLAPMIPGLNDHEMERLLEAARDAGASSASYIALRLPLEVTRLFQDWLAEHYPDRTGKVMKLVREMHGGKDYDPRWGTRMSGEGVYADLMRKRFEGAARRTGLNRRSERLRTDLFAPPPAAGDQLAFDGF